MKIRLAEEEDVPRIVEVKNWGDRDGLKRVLERIAETKEGQAAYLVVEEDGKIIGHLFLKYYGTQTAPDYPAIEDAYVREDFRGQGLGTKLIREAEKVARHRGFRQIGLAVNPTLNPRARALYERLGYKEIGTPLYLDGVYDGIEDWVIDMVKDLP